MMGKIEVVCHRGANKVAPENTRAAAQKCIEWGVAYVEVDVRTSKDGVMYLLHDPTVDRTTNGSGRLRELTSAEIDRLDAGSAFSPTFAGEPLPRLDSYLQWIKGKAKIFFDVKDADLSALIALVRQNAMEQECFFWFGKDAEAQAFRRLAPDLTLKINAYSVEAIHRAYHEYRPGIIETGLDNLSPEMLTACHDHRMKLMVLYMQSDPVAFRRIIEGNADMINLDDAETFLRVQEAMMPL